MKKKKLVMIIRPLLKKNFGSATASILCLFPYLITRKYDNLQAFKKKNYSLLVFLFCMRLKLIS